MQGALAGITEAWIFAVALVFARVGTALVLLPGFGENQIPARSKVFLGLAISLGLMPALAAPAPPAEAPLLALMIGKEMLVGVFIGVGARILMSALHVLGAQVAFTSGLSNALTPNQANPESGSALAALMTMGAVVCLFLTNAHHVMLTGIMRSYAMLPPGQVMLSDMVEQIARLGGAALYIAVTVGAPFYVISLLINLGMGLANRVMPAMQVFFVMGPGLIMGGLLVLMIAVPVILTFQIDQISLWFETFTW